MNIHICVHSNRRQEAGGSHRADHVTDATTRACEKPRNLELGRKGSAGWGDANVNVNMNVDVVGKKRMLFSLLSHLNYLIYA